MDTGKACQLCNMTKVLPYRLKLAGIKNPEAALMNSELKEIKVSKLDNKQKENKEYAKLKTEDEK